MSEKKINDYRLTSMEEPTDEMLNTLMKEVAEEAKSKGEEATERFFKQMNRNIEAKKVLWAKKYKVSFGNE